MFAYGKGDITRVQGGFVEPDADISDVFDAALPYFLYNERSNSKSSAMNDIYEPLLEIIEDNTGQKFNVPIFYPQYQGDITQVDPKVYENQKRQEIIDWVKAHPEQLANIQNIEELISDEAIQRNAKESQEKYDEVLSRAGFGSKLIGSLGGGVVGSFQDPLVVASIPLAIANTVKGSLLAFALREAILAGGVEALIQPSVADWYKTLGKDYGPEEFFTRVGAASGFAGSASLFFGGIGKVFGKSLADDSISPGQAEEGISLLNKVRKESGQKLSDAEQTALEILEQNSRTETVIKKGVAIDAAKPRFKLKPEAVPRSTDDQASKLIDETDINEIEDGLDEIQRNLNMDTNNDVLEISLDGEQTTYGAFKKQQENDELIIKTLEGCTL